MLIDLLMQVIPPVPVSKPGDPTIWGMPLPVVLSLLAIVATILGALSTAVFKKFRTPADDREDKVMVLDASDRLIARFEGLLKESDAKHDKEIKELSDKLAHLEAQVETMRVERYTLVSALIQVAGIARKYGGMAAEEEIRLVEVPDGVRIHRLAADVAAIGRGSAGAAPDRSPAD